jgi:hypothetical protein
MRDHPKTSYVPIHESTAADLPMIDSVSMLKLLASAFLLPAFLFSQSVPPNLWGAWKADLHASKFAGPPVSNYLEIVGEGDFTADPQTHQTAHGIKELTGSRTEEGGRELLTFSVNQPVVAPYRSHDAHDCLGEREQNSICPMIANANGV